ncbi:copper resistance CopC family protein [Kiloniella majae]|uniref:copper resistance CopC family protein n=1 Tax=Kiloniella majae TaxID=1938558 RepID=UPI001302D7FD|nr:copper resistance CopC family protein [Kiloniella majae]
MAHTKVARTIPANEAVLKESPSEIKLIFPEVLKITALKLLDTQGNELTLEHDKSLKPIKEKIAFPPSLDAGTYRVIWRGISADGHPIKGQIIFTVSP